VGCIDDLRPLKRLTFVYVFRYIFFVQRCSIPLQVGFGPGITNKFALLSLFATPRLRVKTGWPLFTAAIVRAASLPGAERCRFQSLQTCYHLFNIFVLLFAFHIGQPLLQLSKVVLDNGLERRVGTEALLIALHLLGIVDIVGQDMGVFH